MTSKTIARSIMLINTRSFTRLDIRNPSMFSPPLLLARPPLSCPHILFLILTSIQHASSSNPSRIHIRSCPTWLFLLFYTRSIETVVILVGNAWKKYFHCREKKIEVSFYSSAAFELEIRTHWYYNSFDHSLVFSRIDTFPSFCLSFLFLSFFFSSSWQLLNTREKHDSNAAAYEKSRPA